MNNIYNYRQAKLMQEKMAEMQKKIEEQEGQNFRRWSNKIINGKMRSKV